MWQVAGYLLRGSQRNGEMNWRCFNAATDFVSAGFIGPSNYSSLSELRAITQMATGRWSAA